MNFRTPQRQSKVGIFINFAYELQRSLRALLPVVVILILRFDNQMRLYLALGVLFFMAFSLVWAYFTYKNFVYYISDSEEFVLESGVLSKAKLMIALDKIQQVNINQSFIHRLVGVYRVEIESAGSSDKEVVLKAVSQKVALALRERLAQADCKSESVARVALAQHEKTTAIGWLSLIKVGLTSHYLRTFLLLLLFVNTIYEKLSDFWVRDVDADSQWVESYVDQNLGFVAVLLLLGVVVFLVLTINLTQTLIKFGNYTVVKQGRSLVLSFGLLANRTTIIRPERVQRVIVGQNYFQKKLQILNLQIQQISGGKEEEGQKKTAMEIPGCSPAESSDFLELIFGQLPQKGAVLTTDVRYLWMRFLLFGMLPAILIALWGYGKPQLLIYTLAAVYAVAAFAVCYRMYKQRVLFVSADFIVLRKGFWEITEEYIQPHKIQMMSSSQFFWQRSADIGNIVLYTAAGRMSFGTTRYKLVSEWADQWLSQVERYNRSWM